MLYKGWDTPATDKLIATMLCFLHVKQTNVFQCMLFMIFVCSLPYCMHSYYVLLLELHLSCTCLEFFDPNFQCFQMVGSIVRVHVTSKIILFITYLLED